MLQLFGLFVGLALACASSAQAAEYYVATTGNDSNAGTMSQPFATLQKGANVAVAGDTVWIRGGTYSIVTPATSGAGINFTKSGTSDTNRIKYFAYAGETPVFDFSKLAISTTGYTSGFAITGSWLHFRGLEICNVPMNTRSNTGMGVNDPAHDNIFELLNIHHNKGSAFFINRGGGGHLILNCDAHDNYDPTSSQGDGQNADGFGAHYQTQGKVTTFRGCRAWWNSDDGWDLISQEYPVVIENSWAFGNGYINSGMGRPADGNGTGFKVGSSKTGVRHIVRNNVAWGNRANGFYANHSSGGNDWFNNTAYNNGTQFNMWASTWDAAGNRTDGVSLTGARAHKLRNNIGFPHKNSYVDGYGVDSAFNTWDLDITPAAADFASVSDMGFMGPRQADGSLPNLDFMKLRAGSKLIDKGTNVGLPHVGAAPDLGAYEFGAAPTGGTGGTGGTGTTGGMTAGGAAARGGADGLGGGAGISGSPSTGGAVAAGGAVSSGGRSGESGATTSASGGNSALGGSTSVAAGAGGLIGGSGAPSSGGALGATGGTSMNGGSSNPGTGGSAQSSGGVTLAAGGSATAGGSNVPSDSLAAEGCSCSVPGASQSGYGAAKGLAALGIAMAALLRRRRPHAKRQRQGH